MGMVVVVVVVVVVGLAWWTREGAGADGVGGSGRAASPRYLGLEVSRKGRLLLLLLLCYYYEGKVDRQLR